MCYDQLSWVLILGDLNANYIENEDVDTYLPPYSNYCSDTCLATRISQDSKILKKNGDFFVEFCKCSGFRILNGRFDTSFSYEFTCFTSNENSVVDNALLKEKCFENIS